MKGVVFTEFLDMVEDVFGIETVDNVIEASEDKLSTGGAYTAIGTYQHSEMITLVTQLSKETELPVDKLVYTFGKHLLGRFTSLYGHFFQEAKDTFDFLESIENYIHVEVRKLYPDAELPTFETQRISESKLVMDYYSERAMGDLAAGLIQGTIEQYGESITFDKENIAGTDGKKVRFTLTKS